MFEKVIAEVIGFLFWLINIIINSTIRLKVLNKEIIDKTHEQNRHLVLAGWHGEFFPFTYYFRHTKTCILPITSLRGKILAALAKRHGYRTIPYPEFGTPGERIQSVQEVLKAIKEGFDLAIAVDGPPEPKFHKVNAGVLYFSQKSGSSLIPLGIFPKRKLTLFWRWDKYEVPLPFSEVVIAFGEPILVPAEMDAVELEKKTAEVKARMDEIHQTAKSASG